MTEHTARRWRFSLRAVFWVLLGSGLVLGCIARPRYLARLRAAEDEVLRHRGAWVVQRHNRTEQIYVLVFDQFQDFDPSGISADKLALIIAHPDLIRLEMFSEGTDARLMTPEFGLDDAAVLRIAKLQNLETLKLYGRGITDASLPALRQLPNLHELWLVNTSVSQAGIEKNLGGRPDLQVCCFNTEYGPIAAPATP